MIVFLSTAAHDYTHRRLEKVLGVDVRRISYDRFLTQRRIPAATYVFTDVDRLGFWEQELAARVYRQLQRAGMRVLNDPARVRQRFSLLRALKHNGFNTFDVWRADDSRRPEESQYPVFLRTASAHRGTLTDLLPTPAALDSALQDALGQGIPRGEILIVEYRAQPLRPGLFRKLSAFRLGDRMVTTLCVHESKWTAKYGEQGIADQALYDEEHRFVRDNAWGEPLRAAFETAEVDYGRADFAVVDGRPEVYEINTNPNHGSLEDHPFPIRLESQRIFGEAFRDALIAIDTPPRGSAARIEGWPLAEQRRHDRWLLAARWTP